MHADRLDDPAHQLVEVRPIEVALRVVEHAHHAHAEQRHRAPQLVLADRVDVPPVDRVRLSRRGSFRRATAGSRSAAESNQPRVAHTTTTKAPLAAALAIAPPNPNASSPGCATTTMRLRATVRSRTGRQIEDTAGSIRA